MIEVHPYSADDASAWNALVAASRNGTFLHDRRFMDYHADRFTDASLLLYKGERLLGVFPASRHGDEVVSHGGLTYGGFITLPDAHATEVGEMLSVALGHYRSEGVKSLTVKPVPTIYHRYPADDELYWLYRHDAVLTARGLSSAIDLSAPLPFSTLRRRKVKVAQGAELQVEQSGESADYEAFWGILTHVLTTQHHRQPVHTIDEIRLLQNLFSDSIRLYVVRHPSTHEIVAGTLLFVTPQVAHAQYIAASDEGRRLGALDLLFDHLVHHCEWSTQRYFDFGISTEDGGHVLNEGLNFQKEGFGARSVVYDAYRITIN